MTIRLSTLLVISTYGKFTLFLIATTESKISSNSEEQELRGPADITP